ncbi:LPXTG cell wall anchor domain-containing protein [Micromonospora sp. WMMD812]|uniref:LPXTG cell wall anchor domain-containing protein n=1 Tax=Micromonospora sp. WMMD812 TaxID=3015152 RepID=UPI00248C0F87|nr:LPXTG cell wall anchor domain-containing protein [Micromonospora sp. WMMD812]WBB65624.1 LPXTG cell wall anchor domain-containing protein [Micromonospora sp. WMMD812]
MLKNSTRRWLAGLGVAGAFIAASATPALADDAPFEIVTHELLVAPGHLASGWLFAHPTDTEGELEFGKTTLDVDLSKVEDFATVEPTLWGWACEASPGKLHCEADLPEAEQPWFDYTVTGKDDAKPGQKGDLTVTITSGGKSVTAAAGITIAEGVDLVTEPTVEVSGAPGSRVGVPGTVRNAGASTVNEAVLVVQADWLAPYAGDFSNCTSYEGVVVICTFDSDLEPGKSYRLSENLPVELRPEVRTGAKLPAVLDWWTKADWALASADWPLPPDAVPGKGDELRLVEQAPARARSLQTDVDRFNNFIQAAITVTGDNHADLAAKGSTATGKKGEVVTVRPGFTNLGPALLEYQGEKPPLLITIPAGTTAVEASGECQPYVPGEEWDPWNGEWGEPGAKEYACYASETPQGMEYLYEFALRIDELTGATSGPVAVKLDGDPNAANDTAKITVKLAAGNGSGGDNGQGGGDGDGGTLPITGESTGLIAGIGALLLVAGAGGYLVAKRRRTRFVA